jgi:hypothetical protein
MYCPPYPSWLHHSIYIWRGVQVWSSSLCCLLQPLITSPLFGPNILRSILFSNTFLLRVCSSLNVRDQVSHPYKTTSKILVLCTFSDGRREDNNKILDSLFRPECQIVWYSLFKCLSPSTCHFQFVRPEYSCLCLQQFWGCVIRCLSWRGPTRHN